QWLHDLCRGYDSEAVTPRCLPQSVGCSKNFVGRSVLSTTSQIEHWLRCLADELIERLLEDRQLHSRQATRLTLYVRTNEPVPLAGSIPSNGNGFSRVLPPNLLSAIYARVANQDGLDAVCTTGSVKTSNSTALTSDCEGLLAQKIARCALNVTDEVMGHGKQADVWNPGITCLGLSAGKFCSDSCALSTDIRALLQKQSIIKRDLTPSTSTISTHISPNTKSVSDSKCLVPSDSTTGPPTSFFKRLFTAEMSEPSLLTVVASESPERTVNNMDLNGPVEEHDPSITNLVVEHDTDSRSSAKSDSSVFFTSYIAGDWTVCEECGRRVAVWQVPEHADFHLAQRLQHEWTQAQTTTITANTTRAQNTSRTPSLRSVARGHSRNRGGSSLKRKETITLDKFLIKRAS
ncbi:hypothetical protein AHF37_11860, partial [Paragonimus kellicotti]